MGSLFDGTKQMDDIEKIYNQMEANYHRSPCSISGQLWRLRHECDISPRQRTPKIMLDKAVAFLAESGHMPEWFNRCPVAAGITDPRIDNNYRVDLVHCCKLCRCARLIELKGKSDDLISARRKILRYGAAYIFCRIHENELQFPAESLMNMNVRHVSLEVVAPRRFHNDYNEKDRFERISKTLDKFAASKTAGALSMSLNALAFPEDFEIPFKNGEEVKDKCDTPSLTPEGRKVRDAFNNLTQLWP